jgi:hypothetical protein
MEATSVFFVICYEDDATVGAAPMGLNAKNNHAGECQQ